MKLITVEAKTASENIQKSVDFFNRHADEVRAMSGCQSYDIFVAPANGDTFVIVQKWADMETFDAYRQSALFGIIGQELKPIMTAAPVTTVADF